MMNEDGNLEYLNGSSINLYKPINSIIYLQKKTF